jgi:DNA-binding response OmpR family regulator
LAIVRRIVEQHQGEIAVASTAGHGTTFTVTLPTCAPPPTPTTEEILAAPTHGGLVIIAEPDRMVSGLLASALRAQQREVVQVADADALQAKFQQLRDRVRLLIVDAALPRKQGLRCLRELRSQGVATPAIAVASDVESDVVGLLDDQTLLVRKPFRASEVAALANRLLGTISLPQTPRRTAPITGNT